MEDIILELCEVKPMKLSELAKLLNRNDVGLRSNYLNKLVKQNKLKFLYPGQINVFHYVKKWSITALLPV